MGIYMNIFTANEYNRQSWKLKYIENASNSGVPIIPAP